MPESNLKNMASNMVMFILCVVTACLLAIHIIRPNQPVLITTESVRSLEQTIKSQQNTIELQRRTLTILESKLGFQMPQDTKLPPQEVDEDNP